ncbi:hypothetical protein N7532_009293 [Penicillium argentinense]|uniref:Uncharacterized protein n=1 Tax=Penicillium argentinense TaxID=1131581 RepID=A0A9W9EZ85_9EURO|nr:uncharacterized protein N7532_009293 [Penicillium argentinense]KAJ5090609.1 hypothetical protein N7532_009293 [Penicillium argentinense]
MSDLSGVFHRFFQEAKNLVAIHLGFPQKHPLNLTPDAIFHGIRWKTLRTLSLQGWRLSANEIISLAHRHHHELRELRLVGVYLRAGSRWSTVLSMLRSEMDRLDCLELRGINYDAYLEDLATSAGVEVFDPAPLLPSPPSSLSVVAAGTSPPDNPPLLRGDRMLDRSAMSEKVKGLSADELGDDGVRVRRGQERLWEAWALSPPQSARNGIAYGYGNGNANGNGNGIKIGLR